MGYDEAYLNEKIAKASKSWEGVDVDKFLDEIRGREPITTCNELEEAAEKYARDEWAGYVDEDTWYLEEKTCSAFKAGAEWARIICVTPRKRYPKTWRKRRRIPGLSMSTANHQRAFTPLATLTGSKPDPSGARNI